MKRQRPTPSRMDREQIEELIYGKADQHVRFTQDFPVLPDVWIAFAESPVERVELLLTPYSPFSAATLNLALRDRLAQEKATIEAYNALYKSLGPTKPARIIFNESVVYARLTFAEMLRVALPLTEWWKHNFADFAPDRWTKTGIAQFLDLIQQDQYVATGQSGGKAGASGEAARKISRGNLKMLRKFVAIAGSIAFARRKPVLPSPRQQREEFSELLENLAPTKETRGVLYSVSVNRKAKTSVWRSRVAVKADAVARVFDVDTSSIRWAVLDTGIDARHTAFAKRNAATALAPALIAEDTDEYGNKQFASRVVRTYDFLRYKTLMDPDSPIEPEGTYAATLPKPELRKLTADLKRNIESGRMLDWDLIEPFLRIPHRDKFYDSYLEGISSSHGTHVAGIIAANWPEAKETSLKRPVLGICPELEIFDLRVLGKDAAGDDADEFTVIAALQFVRHLNAHKDLLALHGVNLSMAVAHDVANYACGRTPICEECERVVANGAVVVTAAGNRGFNKLANPEDGAWGDYRYISITDPGNADSVITVGSTHRFMPHDYGVSYFSSRGPTGDGRVKPDLVAPGEKIDSCSRGDDYETMDGTSMAAPHVSGAAALLMARHRELVGHPKQIKEILCKSATDLGREPRFQGAGMLDILRAMQSV